MVIYETHATELNTKSDSRLGMFKFLTDMNTYIYVDLANRIMVPNN